MNDRINIFWFRRDLRLDDNVALYHALTSDCPVLPIFIFDTNILYGHSKDDARVNFSHNQLSKINAQLQQFGSGLAMYHGKPLEIIAQLTKQYNIKAVYTNRDYQPYAISRDQSIEMLLDSLGVILKTYKDHVVFEKDEVVKQDGSSYKVYTPYMKQWKAKLATITLGSFDADSRLDNLVKVSNLPHLSLSDIGFETTVQTIKYYKLTPALIHNYEAERNFPAKDATSRLGPHLRFGTVSIRDIVRQATSEKNETFLQELIWREFFTQILWHFPYTTTKSFKPKYDRIHWRNNETEFKAWCEGKTGYPLVDAGMRQLNKTGFMHNRVRMLVGSFLCKHLLIDWRWGEAYFAEKLHDYEMASNVGNWQWVAGCGVDAAPYFRIFNPTTQIKKFDENHNYIKEWVPDYQELTYPVPIVDHKFARVRCLQVYKEALS
jgi:deoxyribodipyrimidine photo-lyase